MSGGAGKQLALLFGVKITIGKRWILGWKERVEAVALCIFFTITVVVVSPSEALSENFPRPCSVAFREKVQDFTNNIRELHGLPLFRSHTSLTQSAQTRAIQLAKSQILTHGGWVTAVNQSGFDPRQYAAENIAKGYRTPLAAVHGWYRSSGHRHTTLKKQYRLTGVGCAEDQFGVFWWVQHFGSDINR